MTRKEKKIVAEFYSDFGIILTREMAREVQAAQDAGCALWDREKFVSSRPSDWVWRATRNGVVSLNVFYPKREWNALVEQGHFGKLGFKPFPGLSAKETIELRLLR